MSGVCSTGDPFIYTAQILYRSTNFKIQKCELSFSYAYTPNFKKRKKKEENRIGSINYFFSCLNGVRFSHTDVLWYMCTFHHAIFYNARYNFFFFKLYSLIKNICSTVRSKGATSRLPYQCLSTIAHISTFLQAFHYALKSRPKC